MKIYSALARGEDFDTILPQILLDLNADSVILIWRGDFEAHLAMEHGSMDFLENLKDRLHSHVHSQDASQPTDSPPPVDLSISEFQLRALAPSYTPGETSLHLIRFEEELLGGIAIARPISRTSSTPSIQVDELLLALGIARRVDLAREGNEKAIARLDRIAMVGRVFTESLSLDRTLVRLLEIAVDVAGSEVGTFVIKNQPGSSPTPPVSWGLPPDWTQKIFLEDGENLVEAALDHGNPCFFPNTQGLDSQSLPSFLQSLVVIPMSYEGGSLGCLCIPNPSQAFFESEAERKTLNALASLAGGAVRNAQHLDSEIRAERLREEVRLAAQVQATLLPRELPNNSLLDSAAVMRTALHLGGDLYDMLDLGENRWGMMIADVSGKGPSAAMLMTTARAYFHAHASASLTAGEVLEKMNDALVKDLSDGRFLTAIYILLDLPAREAQIAGAGHLPLFVIQPDGKIADYSCDGLPLGIMPFEKFPTRTFSIPSQTHLLLYTDGLAEARSTDGRLLGTDGLQKILMRAPRTSAKELVNFILLEAEQWLGGHPPSDDLTLLTTYIK